MAKDLAGELEKGIVEPEKALRFLTFFDEATRKARTNASIYRQAFGVMTEYLDEPVRSAFLRSQATDVEIWSQPALQELLGEMEGGRGLAEALYALALTGFGGDGRAQSVRRQARGLWNSCRQGLADHFGIELPMAPADAIESGQVRPEIANSLALALKQL